MKKDLGQLILEMKGDVIKIRIHQCYCAYARPGKRQATGLVAAGDTVEVVDNLSFLRIVP
jgi:hypothetical protein